MACATAAVLTRTVASAGSAQGGTRHQGAKLVSGRDLKGIEKQDEGLTGNSIVSSLGRGVYGNRQ